MDVAIFGATGATGRELVRAALARGHHVIAAARDPAQLTDAHDHLEVRRADVLVPESVAAVVRDADAVLSAIGSGAGRAATTVYSAGITHVLAAMPQDQSCRLVAVTAAPLAPGPAATALERRVAFPLLHRFFGGTYADMREMEAVLGAGAADWTVLRPPRLTDKPARGHYRTAPDHVRGGRSITRADLAAAMLDVLEDPAGARGPLGVAN